MCHAAGSQFITHTIGRGLGAARPQVHTNQHQGLRDPPAICDEEQVIGSFDLYYVLIMYTVNATEQMDKLDRAFEQVKQMLYGRLHDVLRKHIVERVHIPGAPSLRPREAQNDNVAAREKTNHLSCVADVMLQRPGHHDEIVDDLAVLMESPGNWSHCSPLQMLYLSLLPKFSLCIFLTVVML
ncbi:uncharacterized protein [Lolium perenne]|uniref:uncharacterized protein isoform X2 n=1 Tax=Lolium perenne TaxID=4522 RepID=UPI0021F61C4F|nr:uncharacterized protein LOC127331996 isoform X2 [Lolium perenne]XP_051214209.1 uncharacterized protein LOC127331996 isoform X2 [Lolium perenne]